MACRAGSRLPFLIVSHEAVVVRAEEWLTMKKDCKLGDSSEKRGGGRSGGEKGESSSSVAGPLVLVRSASSPTATAAAKLLDVEMLSEEEALSSQPLSPRFKLDGASVALSDLVFFVWVFRPCFEGKFSWRLRSWYGWG